MSVVCFKAMPDGHLARERVDAFENFQIKKVYTIAFALRLRQACFKCVLSPKRKFSIFQRDLLKKRMA